MVQLQGISVGNVSPIIIKLMQNSTELNEKGKKYATVDTSFPFDINSRHFE